MRAHEALSTAHGQFESLDVFGVLHILRHAHWRPGAMDADWDEVSLLSFAGPPRRALRGPTARRVLLSITSATRAKHVECFVLELDLSVANRQQERGELITHFTVDSSTPAATGRAVGAPWCHHRPRLRHNPRAALGWQWICAFYNANPLPRHFDS